MLLRENTPGRGASQQILKYGGLLAYLGTDDLRKALGFAKEDDDAALVVDAMAYQIGKEIGGMVAVAGGSIDAIVLTGGMAYNTEFVQKIKEYIGKFALVVIEPGENELLSLALGAKRVLEGTERQELLIRRWQCDSTSLTTHRSS